MPQLECYFDITKIIIQTMNQITIRRQQHSLATKQVPREPAKEVSKLLQNNQYTAEDLMGLSWMLFKEGY